MNGCKVISRLHDSSICTGHCSMSWQRGGSANVLTSANKHVIASVAHNLWHCHWRWMWTVETWMCLQLVALGKKKLSLNFNDHLFNFICDNYVLNAAIQMMQETKIKKTIRTNLERQNLFLHWRKTNCFDVLVDSWCGLFSYTRLWFAMKRAAFWVCVCINLFVLHSSLGFVTQEAVCGCGALHRLLIALNHRWLFSGPTMLHIICLHFTFCYCSLCFLCRTDVW